MRRPFEGAPNELDVLEHDPDWWDNRQSRVEYPRLKIHVIDPSPGPNNAKTLKIIYRRPYVYRDGNNYNAATLTVRYKDNFQTVQWNDGRLTIWEVNRPCALRKRVSGLPLQS